MLGITGVSLYLVFPTLMSVLGSAPEVATIRLRWFFAMAVLQVGSVFCQVELQRIASGRISGCPSSPPARRRRVGRSTRRRGRRCDDPDGYVVRAGIPTAAVASGLTAASLLTFGALVSLPRACRACCRSSRRRATSSASCGSASACSWSWPAQAPSSSPTSASAPAGRCAARAQPRSCAAPAAHRPALPPRRGAPQVTLGVLGPPRQALLVTVGRCCSTTSRCSPRSPPSGRTRRGDPRPARLLPHLQISRGAGHAGRPSSASSRRVSPARSRWRASAPATRRSPPCSTACSPTGSTCRPASWPPSSIRTVRPRGRRGRAAGAAGEHARARQAARTAPFRAGRACPARPGSHAPRGSRRTRLLGVVGRLLASAAATRARSAASSAVRLLHDEVHLA